VSHSESKKSTRNQNLSINSAFDGENNFQFVNSNGNDIAFTDYGAIDRAFDAFDTASGVVTGTLSAFGDSTDKTISALKEFATQITVGDIESAKFISFAIIAAVLVGVVAFVIWG